MATDDADDRKRLKRLASEVWRPKDDRQVLYVLGDVQHFWGSVLAKAAKTFFSVADAQADDRGDAHGPLAIKWAPFSRYDVPPEARQRFGRIINDTHFNCDKDRVASSFEAVAGYSHRVDPHDHVGPAILKARRNAMHDARPITCPTSEPVPSDRVVERLIDNTVGGDHVADIRVPIINGTSPYAYVKLRPVASRFSNTNSYAQLVSTSQVLTLQELDLCHAFARHIGLEYGEIDVLRDRQDGRIYIVDANNTPYGPPNGISRSEGQVAIRLIADAFAKAIFAPAYTPDLGNAHRQ